MIRDPSDGSVREAPKIEDSTPNAATVAALEEAERGGGEVVSGLREPSKRGDVQARLEASREWLKAYFQRKTG